MNFFNNLPYRLAGSAGILAIAIGLSSGLSTPALAGAILSDFTLDYTGNADANLAQNGALQSASGGSDSLETTALTFFLPSSVGANLTVQGFRSSFDDGYSGAPYEIRLTRRSAADEVDTDNRGFSLCSVFRTDLDPDYCRSGGGSSTAIEGHDTLQDEAVRFSIADGFDFAVQYFSFGDVGLATSGGAPNDNARLYFGDMGQFLDFNVRLAAEASIDTDPNDGIQLGCVLDAPFQDNPSTNVNRTCTVDIYNVVRTQIFGGTANDETIFNYLASDYFTFAAINSPDDWYIRGAQWVVAGPAIDIFGIPEPASLTLLGAGLLGLGYFGKRRKA